MITIYGRDNCPFCVRAKELCERKQYPYEYLDIVQNKDNKKRMLESAPNAKTVPQIFVDQTHIGGYDELLKAQLSGDIDQLLGR